METLTISQLQAQLIQVQEELALAASYIDLLETENKQLKVEIEELSVNPNFNCNTRIAGFQKAERRIKDRRANHSDCPISLVTVDIGGMGLSNSTRGEIATNIAMTNLLQEIRTSFRGVLVVDGQLNSGDEFLFWVSCPVEDVLGIMARLDDLAKKWGFKGAYCGSVEVAGQPDRCELVDLANQGMEQVYLVKEKLKNN